MAMWHERTTAAARGRWRGILVNIGIPETFLTGKGTACPLCGEGKDRFTYDDHEGKGTWICRKCGAGGGIELVKRFLGCDFAAAAARVDEIIRNVKPGADPSRPTLSEDDRRAALRALWADTRPAEASEGVGVYLAARGLSPSLPEALRFAPHIRDGEGGIRPAMVAMVSGPDGKPATLHRTFLRSDCRGKAEMARPKKLMPGSLPDSFAVRLGPAAEAMGIAEGIETALAAAELFEIPVWSGINDGGLAKWQPPACCTEVTIFGDHDASYAGQAAAYTLASRLAARGLDVTVRLPPVAGQDWLDVLNATPKTGSA